MSTGDVKEAFEDYAPQVLEAAWEYADNSTDVQAMTIVFVREGGLSVAVPTYVVHGERRGCHQLTDIGVDCSQTEQGALLRELNFKSFLFVQAAGSADDVPSMILIDYSVADQEMNAEFFYDDLQPGVPEAQQVPLARIAKKWVDRYVETGDRSFLAYDPKTWQD